MSTSEKNYHHGDLRQALLTAAVEVLESGEAFSMRAVARRAGVSQTAPYRHFADRTALDNAVAARGFADLNGALATSLATLPSDSDAHDVLTELAVTYVMFALTRQAEFRIMFGSECDDADADRVLAAANLRSSMHAVAQDLFPGADAVNLSIAFWSIAHGLAFLHLDGKLRPEPVSDVVARVRASITAVLATARSAS